MGLNRGASTEPQTCTFLVPSVLTTCNKTASIPTQWEKIDPQHHIQVCLPHLKKDIIHLETTIKKATKALKGLWQHLFHQPRRLKCLGHFVYKGRRGKTQGRGRYTRGELWRCWSVRWLPFRIIQWNWLAVDSGSTSCRALFGYGVYYPRRVDIVIQRSWLLVKWNLYLLLRRNTLRGELCVPLSFSKASDWSLLGDKTMD